MILRLPDKDPAEVLDYTVDLSQWVAANTLLDNSPSVTVALDGASRPSADASLAVSSITVGASALTFWLSGGVHGEEYVLRVAGTDNASPERTFVRRLVIKVRYK